MANRKDTTPTTINLDLTRKEIDILADFYKSAEARAVNMREYLMANDYKERGRTYTGIQKTAWYLNPTAK